MTPIIPVYLNQKLVFDLIAMMRNGMSTITKVSKQASRKKTNNTELSGSFGLGAAFSNLLKIDLSAKDASSNSSDMNETKSEERVHTPASILFNLIQDMNNKEILKKLDAQKLPKVGEYVEFDAILTRNPLVETMDALSQILKVANTFTADASLSNNQKKRLKQKIMI